jgi:hypothetical protein
MHKKFITAVAAASIMITGFAAAPARADSDDTKRALAALLGIAIIGAVIHDANKDHEYTVRRHKVQPRHRPHVQPRRQPHLQPRPLPKRVDRKVLPSQCLRTFKTRRGHNVREFGLGCLRNNYRFVNHLPQRCARTDRTHSGLRHGYDVKCLRAQGYRLSRS